MYKKLFIFFASLMTMPFVPVSHGAIIDHGLYTTDTATNLEWLDVTATAGMSVDNISGQLGLGGQFQSWRYASGNELNQFFANAGGNPLLQGDYLAHEGIVDLMISLLGDTFCEPRLKAGVSCFTFSGLQFTFGLLSDVDTQGSNFVGVFQDHDRCPAAPGTCEGAIFNTHGFSLASNEALGGVGSFLVRSVGPVAVSEPFTLPLVFIGLMGLAIMRRKGRTHKMTTNNALN